MIRTQIQLEEETYRQLKTAASALGCSISELVRRSLKATISSQKINHAWAKSLKAVGRYRSTLGDLAQNHDRYLTDEW